MADIVLMPQLGISEESAVLTKWFAKKGDVVEVGDIIFSIETGKSSYDVESEYAGTVLELLVSEYDEVPIMAPVCVIGQPGESYKLGAVIEVTDVPPGSITDVPPLAITDVPPLAITDIPPLAITNIPPCKAATSGVSPRARNLAKKAGVDPTLAVPTGPAGRIIERDVRLLMETGAVSIAEAGTASTAETGVASVADTGAASFAESDRPEHSTQLEPSSQADIPLYYDKPLSPMRKTIAKNMVASLAQTAQLTHTASFDATSIIAYRKNLKSYHIKNDITLNDMVLFAVSRTLGDYPDLNAWLDGDMMRCFNDVNLACAVDTPRGLMVPVIFGANKKSLSELSCELKSLAEGCRDGSIAPELMTGGSFTVSNLGVYGIESFTPILNPPQTGIIGVNTITQRVREVDGNLSAYPAMGLSLTYDHRAIDGAPASRFLQALCKNLEDFTCLMAF